MSNSLYDNSDKKLNEFEKSQERLNKLSIEYNPLNQIKRDLGVVTRIDEIDESNVRNLLEIKNLTRKYGDKRRIVDAGLIYDYCLGHNYRLRPIRKYRSELPEKSLQAIEEFTRENNIDISHNKDNFFILAPVKYFDKDNMDTSNVAFNIYYKEEYIRQPNPRDKMVEVYGSNFKRSLFSPLNEILRLESTDESLHFTGKFMISLTTFVVAMVICAFALFLQFNICNAVIKITMVILGLLFISIWREYKKVFKDRQYIYRITDIESAMEKGNFKIR